MKRFHALEWEDLSWFPNSWRDYGTDYLSFIATKFKLYQSIIPIIKKGIVKSGTKTWVDCASGGGSGLLGIVKDLKHVVPHLEVILTDYYPNQKAFEKTKKNDPEVFSYEEEPVDVLDLPDHLQGHLRTLFGAFHHFRPDDAREILQNAVDTNSPIAVFEPVGRNFMSWFSMLFVILNVLLFTPFIRPVRWQILPFIYIIPLIPLYILWDGIASILRTYSKKELEDLISKVEGSEKFEWEIGKSSEKGVAVNYMIGVPK